MDNVAALLTGWATSLPPKDLALLLDTPPFHTIIGQRIPVEGG